MANLEWKAARAAALLPYLVSQLVCCASQENKGGLAAGATVIVFEYLDASKIQRIQLLGQDGNLIDPDGGSTSISDYAEGVEFETSYSMNFLFKASRFENFKTVRVTGPSQSVELDVSTLDWESLGSGLGKDFQCTDFQYDNAYITVLDSRSKPLFTQ